MDIRYSRDHNGDFEPKAYLKNIKQHYQNIERKKSYQCCIRMTEKTIWQHILKYMDLMCLTVP